MTDIETYLHSVVALRARMKNRPKGFVYNSMDEFILRNGKQYTPQELTMKEREFVTGIAKPYLDTFEMKECFFNAQRLLLADSTDKLVYVEGYASSLLPVHHGWLTINDKVIDFTMREWDDKNGRLERVPYGAGIFGVWKEPREYYGVPLPKKRISDMVLKLEQWGSLLDDWRNDHQLLREKWSGT